MNKWPVIFLLLSLPFDGKAADVDLDNYYSSAKIVNKGDQWYQQDFANEKLTYMADVVTRQCFFIDRRWNTAIAVDCEQLARRKEWEKVLVWLKPKRGQ